MCEDTHGAQSAALKKVLFISYIYPPLGGSGVQRSLKFSKYLPEFGWQPYVVCGDDPDVFGDGLDESLLEEIPPVVKVWRRKFIDPLGLRKTAHRLLKIPQRRADGAHAAHNRVRTGNPDEKPAEVTRNPLKKALRGLLRIVSLPLSPFEFPPVDAALYWALAIVPGCLRLIRREQIDLIFSTSFPYSDHLAGCLLKKLSGLPWVADFRDPWTQNPSARNTGWRRRVDGWLELKVLWTAGRVIGVSDGYTQAMRGLAPERDEQHFVTITNGFDSPDLKKEVDSRREKPPPGFTRLVHLGKVYDGTALAFLHGIEAIGEAAACLSIRFIGGLPQAEQRYLNSHTLAASILQEPRLPHGRVVQARQEADVLLLFVLPQARRSGHIPGKLFEYLACGRPVLLIGQPGDASDLIEESGVGYCVPGDRVDEIAGILSLIASRPQIFRERYYHPRTDVIARYERRALAGRLAEVFKELVDEG